MRRIFQHMENRMDDTPQIKSGAAELIISPQGETYQWANKANLLPRNRFLVTCLVMLMSLVSISNLNGQSLQNYQQEAAQNNPELYALFLNYRSALEKRSLTGTLPDPEVAFAYFISPIETRLGPQKARVSVTQMFPWFGSLADNRAISTAEAKARFEQFQERRNRLFYQMEELWGELYVIDQNIESVKGNLSIINTLLELSLQQYENGLTSQVDVLRAQIEQEDLKTKLALLQDNKSLLIQEFNELRNMEPNDKVATPSELNNSENSVDLEVSRLAQNPSLSKLRYTKEASSNAVDLAAKEGKPGFGIGFDYIATGKRTDVVGLANNGKDALIARASFRIPLFRNKYNANVRQAKLNLSSVQQDITALENQLETSFLTAQRDVKDAQRRFELYNEKQIQRIEQAIRILTDAYSTSNAGFEEILRLQRKLLDYQLKRDQAKADEFRAMSYIQYLNGVNNISPNEINY